MAKKKGDIKTGGRVKGSQNKVTKAAKDQLIKILEGEVNNVKNSLAAVRKDSDFLYLKIVVGLFPYVFSKKVDIKSDDKPLQANILNLSGLTDEQLDRIAGADNTGG